MAKTKLNPGQKLIALYGQTTALAKLDTARLSTRVNNAVTNALSYVEERCKAVEEAYLTNQPIAEINRLIALRTEAQWNFDAYMEEQKELFRSKRLDPFMAYSHAIVPVGETTNPHGQVIQLMRIIKRDTTLVPQDPNDESRASVSGSHSYSEGVGASDEMRRGKYNDGHLLIEQSTASIDRGEIIPFGRACL